jgi:hypothetical protein
MVSRHACCEDDACSTKASSPFSSPSYQTLFNIMPLDDITGCYRQKDNPQRSNLGDEGRRCHLLVQLPESLIDTNMFALSCGSLSFLRFLIILVAG